MIPYGRQDISEDDIAAVVAILRSDWLTQGPAIERFERKVADYCGARFAVAVANATAALHIACLALGIGEGDRVWTSPNTFVASANCARYCGAQVSFVDIDPASYNLSLSELQARLETAAKNGTLPRLVIPVHFAGQSCDMSAIADLAQCYGFKVLEDASHAIGGSYLGKPIGNCDYADAAVFSFHPVKIVTSGEGGMIVTNREDLYQHLLRLRSHGITRDPLLMEGAADGDWYYQQLELGFNYRMTDLQAALGASQMERIDEFIARRRELAARYQAALAHTGLVLPAETHPGQSAWHLYAVQTPTPQMRRPLFDRLRRTGIGVNVHYIPVYLQPYYRRLGHRPGECPQAETYYQRAISLPMFPRLSDQEFESVVDIVTVAMREI